jgi:hypothetical protein
MTDFVFEIVFLPLLLGFSVGFIAGAFYLFWEAGRET